MVAIENLLLEKLLVFSPLLSSSKYVGGVKATARLFVASVSKQKPSAHFIVMAEMVGREYINIGPFVVLLGTFNLERNTRSTPPMEHSVIVVASGRPRGIRL